MTQEQKQSIIKLRLNGVSLREIARTTGLKEGAIRRVLSLSGIRLTSEQRGKNKEKIDKNKAIELRSAGITIKEIAAYFNVSEAGIKTLFYRTSTVIPEETRKKNAVAAITPEHLAKMRAAGLTSENTSRRSQAIKNRYNTDQNLVALKSRQSKEIWSKKTPEDIARTHPKGRGSHKNKHIIKESGLSSMQEYYQKKADAFEGQLISEYRHSHDESTRWRCKQGHEFSARPYSVTNGHWCPRCSRASVSVAQEEILGFVRELGFNAESQNKKLITNPVTGRFLELDIVVPEKKLAIEFNGLLYHSEYFERKEYSDVKKTLCSEKGLDYFMIYEDEWQNKKDLIKSMIRSRLGTSVAKKINASNLAFLKFDRNSDFAPFFDANHLDGNAIQAYAGYCLLDGNNILCCLSIRKNFSGEIEIARFATHRDFIVRGGFSRLLARVLRDLPVGAKLVTYSSNRLGNGDVYAKNGFSFVGETGRGYQYTDRIRRYSRYSCRRINDPEILARWPGVQHTEKAQAESGMMAMERLGFKKPKPLYRIYDCGNKKWELTVSGIVAKSNGN